MLNATVDDEAEEITVEIHNIGVAVDVPTGYHGQRAPT
jgi:hypothetical protein